MIRLLVPGLLALALAGCTPARRGAEHGAELHAQCLDCHGTAIYLKPDRKIRTLEGLHRETRRWADYYDPAFSEQEVDDLVAYLNRDFYRF